MGDGKSLAHSYRILQHWNQWLAQHFLGEHLLQAEQHLLTSMLKQHYGKHALLIGVPHQLPLLTSTVLPCHTLLSPLLAREKSASAIEGDLHELPILTGSMDLVMLPHTLECVDNPRQLLAEACRIIKPEGLIVIGGFNPYSLWGIKKAVTRKHVTPWEGNFIHAGKIKSWLKLADFELEEQCSTLFSPPVKTPNVYKKFQFLEKIGHKWCPLFGGVYILLARAKVIPLTPIKLKWKQQLSSIRIPSTISGHIARSDNK